MRKFGFEGPAFMMGLVLGPMFELAFRQSLLYRDLFIFFKHPISAILLVISLILLISPIFSKISKKRKKLEKILEE